jgi:hypothetical protein
MNHWNSLDSAIKFAIEQSMSKNSIFLSVTLMSRARRVAERRSEPLTCLLTLSSGLPWRLS